MSRPGAASIERVGGAIVLTIDREHAGNSISPQVTGAIEAAAARARAEDGVRALVLTGRGRRFFSAGGDIKQYRALETAEQLESAFARPRALMDELEALPVPVIAAVNGYALGGGAELMLACDLRIAGRGARIGFPYVKLGLMAGWHGVERLVRDCGHVRAMELLLTGEPVSAAQAERIGLVNRVVDDGAELDAALEVAEGLVAAAPLAVATGKRVLKKAAHMEPGALRAMMDREFADLWTSADHREAEAAFEEKRAPRFRGE